MKIFVIFVTLLFFICLSGNDRTYAQASSRGSGAGNNGNNSGRDRVGGGNGVGVGGSSGGGSCSALGGTCQSSCNAASQSDQGQLDCSSGWWFGIGSQTCCVPVPQPSATTCTGLGGTCQSSCDPSTQSDQGQLDCGFSSSLNRGGTGRSDGGGITGDRFNRNGGGSALTCCVPQPSTTTCASLGGTCQTNCNVTTYSYISGSQCVRGDVRGSSERCDYHVPIYSYVQVPGKDNGQLDCGGNNSCCTPLLTPTPTPPPPPLDCSSQGTCFLGFGCPGSTVCSGFPLGQCYNAACNISSPSPTAAPTSAPTATNTPTLTPTLTPGATSALPTFTPVPTVPPTLTVAPTVTPFLPSLSCPSGWYYVKHSN